MKTVITGILTGIILYLLLPLVSRFIPHHHLVVVAVTAGLIAWAVAAVMSRI